jgi:hypothetical protein
MISMIIWSEIQSKIWSKFDLKFPHAYVRLKDIRTILEL